MKRILRDLCPPIIWNALRSLRPQIKTPIITSHGISGAEQDLEIYWTPEMAAMLETWGEGNVWSEIQLLMVDRQGRTLDIACGTGKTMEILSKFPGLELHGFDISDFLLSKAEQRGIPKDRLRVCDATRTDYSDGEFDYSYSIGSLEHFTEQGIVDFLSEASRVTRKASFHMIPVSRSGKDEGWLKTVQSFHNNSIDWWLKRFTAAYDTVYVCDSKWQDEISVGRWFLCLKD
jgi:SAM-dependent methyltransferase